MLRGAIIAYFFPFLYLASKPSRTGAKYLYAWLFKPFFVTLGNVIIQVDNAFVKVK